MAIDGCLEASQESKAALQEQKTKASETLKSGHPEEVARPCAPAPYVESGHVVQISSTCVRMRLDAQAFA